MKKGITLIMLTIAVVILSILTGAIIYFSDDMLKTVKKSEFAIEILNVQTYADNYYEEHGGYPASNLVQFNVENLDSFALSQFDGETINDNIVNLYKLDVAAIGIEETIFGNNNTELDVYVISKTTGKVYYLYGVKINNEIHYTLNETLYGYVDSKEEGFETIKIKDVIFNVSSIENTKEPVRINVRLPKDATLDSINATNSVAIGQMLMEKSYQKIPVNTTNVTGNYTVTVVYTIDSKQNTAKYEVKNADNAGPVILVTNTKQTGYTVLEINVTDELSGVDKIKYETVAVTGEEYFKYSGKILSDNKINCYTSGTYTIYAIDKVGNITLVTENVVVD